MSLLNIFTNAFVKPERSFAQFKADVVEEENATDDLNVTEHPVQRGAMISDHAIKLPPVLTVRMKFSDNDKPLEEIYEEVLKLQTDRELFEVITGKRVYKDMILKTIAQITDKNTEKCLALVLTFKNVIIVDTQVTTLPPRARQRSPGKTGATETAGTKQPKKSAINFLFGGE